MDNLRDALKDPNTGPLARYIIEEHMKLQDYETVNQSKRSRQMPHRYFIEEGHTESVATSDMPRCCRKQTNGPVKSFRCTVCGTHWTHTRQQSPRQAFYVGWDGREYPEVT